jgi:hypothetical protein
LPFTEFYRRNAENRICGKKKGNLSSAFEKADSQWKYIFESRHSRTKTKGRKKTRIYIISPTFFHLYGKKMALIGQKRSILKMQKPPAYLGLGLSLYIKKAQSIW